MISTTRTAGMIQRAGEAAVAALALRLASPAAVDEVADEVVEVVDAVASLSVE